MQKVIPHILLKRYLKSRLGAFSWHESPPDVTNVYIRHKKYKIISQDNVHLYKILEYDIDIKCLFLCTKKKERK